MGTDLVRGWMVMHNGFDNKDEPSKLQRLHLINTRSGQVIGVDLEEVNDVSVTYVDWN